MPRKINEKAQSLLSNKEWLIDFHVKQRLSITELSTLLKVTPAVIRRFIKKHNIQSPTQQELREASNIRKYGVANVSLLPSVRKKAMSTMNSKYGGHNWSHKSNKRGDRDNTCLFLYGNSNVGKTQYSINKAKETNLLKYGREHVNQSHIPVDVIDKLNNKTWMYDQHVNKEKSLSLIAEELGFNDDMTTVMRYLHKHHIVTQLFQHSTDEREVYKFIQSILPSVDVVTNTRSIISPKELDIYIPSHKIAIEYCGLYWHSEQQGKDKWYHYNKWKECNDMGIQLITIFEDEWRLRKELVKSKLKNILRVDDRPVIYARKCEIKFVSTKDKQIFFNNNHIQGDGPGSVNIGLYNNTDMVACMSFIKKQNKEYCLNRYATSFSVPGGFSKLLNYFQQNYDWTLITSFADRRWSMGNLYTATGWQCAIPIKPDYMYIENNKRIHKFNYRRKYLPTKLKNFNPDLSERQNCNNNGILRIWDCGKLKFTIHNTE